MNAIVRYVFASGICFAAFSALGSYVSSGPPGRLDLAARALRGEATQLALFLTALGYWYVITARRALHAYFKDRAPLSGKTPVFLSESGAGLSLRSMQALIANLARRANIAHAVSAHTCRHTFALNFLKQHPGKLVELAVLLGHDSVETTAVYTQPSAEEMADDLERRRSKHKDGCRARSPLDEYQACHRAVRALRAEDRKLEIRHGLQSEVPYIARCATSSSSHRKRSGVTAPAVNAYKRRVRYWCTTFARSFSRALLQLQFLQSPKVISGVWSDAGAMAGAGCACAYPSQALG
jgi:Phage integrase family